LVVSEWRTLALGVRPKLSAEASAKAEGTELLSARILAFECRAPLIREFGGIIAAAAAQAIHRNLMRSALGASAAVILQAAVTNGGIRVGFGSASILTVEDARAIRRENSAVAAVGYLIRQQGQSCEGHSQ
jgi:hypothetical protein